MHHDLRSGERGAVGKKHYSINFITIGFQLISESSGPYGPFLSTGATQVVFLYFLHLCPAMFGQYTHATNMHTGALITYRFW